MPSHARKIQLVISLTLLALATSACGAPSNAEGSIGGRSFNLADAEPELRDHGRAGRTIVLADREVSTNDEPDQQWLVSVYIPDGLRIELGVPIAIDPEDPEAPTLQVAVGNLEVDDGLGGKVASTSETVFESALSGAITFWSVEKVLAADFIAVLEKGGGVKGQFEIKLED